MANTQAEVTKAVAVAVERDKPVTTLVRHTQEAVMVVMAEHTPLLTDQLLSITRGAVRQQEIQMVPQDKAVAGLLV